MEKVNQSISFIEFFRFHGKNGKVQREVKEKKNTKPILHTMIKLAEHNISANSKILNILIEI